jgi:predicted deacetylase
MSLQKPKLWVPEYHDVTVHNYVQVQQHLQMLMAWGVPSWNLMVVPGVGSASASQVQDFANSLRAWKEEGHRLHVHGFLHQAQNVKSRSLWGRWALRCTGGEAEFAGLPSQESQCLLDGALEAWRALEVGDAEGFVPPTWHANSHLLRQCIQAGLRAYGGRMGIWDVQNGWRGSMAMSFAGLPTALLPWAYRWAQLWARLRVKNTRVVLHPCDFSKDRLAATQTIVQAYAQSFYL